MMLGKGDSEDWRASIERVDDSIGYVKSNCVLVCYEFNGGRAKWSSSKIELVRNSLRTNVLKPSS